jgi:ribosome biogenesis protein Nip4
MLACFSKSRNITKSFLQDLQVSFESILEPVLPVLGTFFHEQREVIKKHKLEDFLIYNQIVKLAKSIILRGESQNLFIYSIKISNYFDIPNRLEKKQKLADALEKAIQTNGYVIENGSQSFYYISKVDSLEIIQAELKNSALEPFHFLVTQSEYPKDSSNLFIHF